MTPAQNRTHWRLWGAVRAKLRAAGRTPEAADAQRKTIYRNAGAFYPISHPNPRLRGEPKSSKHLNNDDITAIFARFEAILDGSNLEAQLHAVNQPVRRMELNEEVQALLEKIGVEPPGREAYVDGVCRRVCKCALLDLKEWQWPDVIAALTHTMQHRTGVAHEHPRSEWQRGKKPEPVPALAGVDEDNPF